ncbi:MAG TPA: transglutaminase-like domain-containing protein, partial [Bacteroidia bacterium]|nr:transglutaminase-like domain-containing protein [Bacteroidia bacterium]
MSKKRISKKEVNALIHLLDDPDETIFSHIKSKFLSLGPPVIPHLESAWESAYDIILQKRIEQLIHDIQFEILQKQFAIWKDIESDDLLKGLLLVARYQYPDLSEEKIRKQLKQITQDVWLELNEDLTAVEKINALNHILFEVHNFSGSSITTYYSPQNSFFNCLLETKKGNPVMLSCLYLLVAYELKIPVYGVNLPEHFICAYLDEEKNLVNLSDENSARNHILFYINPFRKGIIFHHNDIDEFITQLKLEPNPAFYAPCNNVEIILRVI